MTRLFLNPNFSKRLAKIIIDDLFARSRFAGHSRRFFEVCLSFIYFQNNFCQITLLRRISTHKFCFSSGSIRSLGTLSRSQLFYLTTPSNVLLRLSKNILSKDSLIAYQKHLYRPKSTRSLTKLILYGNVIEGITI